MPYYGPNEDATTIYLERVFLATDFINGMNFGILICMYASCIHVLWNKRSMRISKFLMVYIAVLFLILVVFSAVSAGETQEMYIDDRNFPGGPWNYFLAIQNLPINVLWVVTFFLLTFLADSLIFWRCWIIWSASRRRTAIIATCFPALLLLASFTIGVIWILQACQPGLSIYSKIPLAFGIAYYSLSVGINVILTILVTARLLLYRHRFKNASASAADPVKFYTSLLTIFVESAALYSTFAICYLVSYGINNPINQIFLSFTTAAQQISASLIVYRLALGTAWQKDTIQKNIVTTIQFNVRTPRPVTTTVASGGIMEAISRSVPVHSTGPPQPVPEIEEEPIHQNESGSGSSPSITEEKSTSQIKESV